MTDAPLVLDPERGGFATPYSDGVPRISFALVDDDGQVLQSYDAEREYYSASTVKMGVMVAVLREVQAGTMRLDDTLTVTHEFVSIVPGAGRFTMEAEETESTTGKPGEEVTVAHLLDRMIAVSANCATNMLFEAVGSEKVARAFADAGTPDCGMDRPYSDEAGHDAGISNRATALGLARFMAAITRGALLDSARTQLAIELLRKQEHREIIGVAERIAEREGVEIDSGSKSGAVEAIEHDVAFVRRDGRTQCIAVCTRGFSEAQGLAAIHAVAAALLDARL